MWVGLNYADVANESCNFNKYANADIWILGYNWPKVDGLMTTLTCNLPNQGVEKALVVPDSNINDWFKSWWFGDTKPPGPALTNSRWSFVGLMVHEMGHAGGWLVGSTPETIGHFPDDPKPLCDDSPSVKSDHTMCPFANYGATNRHMVTLGPHDIHTWANAY